MILKTIKTIGLIISQIIGLLLSLIIIYLIIVMLGALLPQDGLSGGSGGAKVEIYLQSNGVHTDFILPAKNHLNDWKSFLNPKNYPLTEDDYVGFGWGDKAFYIETPRWEDLTLNTAFNALFMDSPSAMHVRYLSSAPAENERCVSLVVSEGNYVNLVTYIKNSFKTENSSAVLIPNASYWGYDQFYLAHGNYTLFNTCNNWTNEGLKVAGIRTARFAVFSKTIIAYARSAAENQ